MTQVPEFKTSQALFDFVLAAIRKQGKPSMDKRSGMCLYRSPDGCKCAAGHLIPDAEYKTGMEGNVIDSVMFIPVWGRWSDKHKMVLNGLQRAHDRAAGNSAREKKESFATLYEREMSDLAKVHGLNYAGAA